MIEEAAQSLHGEESVGPPLSVDDKRWDVAWVYVGGGIAAFDLALIPLALCFVLVTLFWEENYGEESGSSGEPAAPLRTRRKKGWGGRHVRCPQQYKQNRVAFVGDFQSLRRHELL